jgi:xanthine dehydrogenase accessory factor
MNPAWLDALPDTLARGEAAVLVSVARIEGSAPRGPGAHMLVAAETTADTIGGGHLEWQAIHHARKLLAAADRQPQVVRYNLGARLGQCCGGVVWLVFEPVPATALAAWQERRAAVQRGDSLHRQLASGRPASDWQLGATPGQNAALNGDNERWTFVQEVSAGGFPVYLFGAGHVAQALVAQLKPLGARIDWIDSRDDAFAGLDCNGLRALVTDTPESEAAAAPAGAYFLVMTHSHTLDFALCEQIFKRQDFAYFGLIGSRSKRASFEHRLLDRGLRPDRLGEMTCPIGIPGIVSKEPAAIALAVAAQVMQIHNTRQLLSQAGRPRLLKVHSLPE